MVVQEMCFFFLRSWKLQQQIGCWTKNRGRKTPKMDGEFIMGQNPINPWMIWGEQNYHHFRFNPQIEPTNQPTNHEIPYQPWDSQPTMRFPTLQGFPCTFQAIEGTKASRELG